MSSNVLCSLGYGPMMLQFAKTEGHHYFRNKRTNTHAFAFPISKAGGQTSFPNWQKQKTGEAILSQSCECDTCTPMTTCTLTLSRGAGTNKTLAPFNAPAPFMFAKLPGSQNLIHFTQNTQNHTLKINQQKSYHQIESFHISCLFTKQAAL